MNGNWKEKDEKGITNFLGKKKHQTMENVCITTEDSQDRDR